MSKEYQVIHKKSNVLTNGQPKLPSASTIDYGEIAINYAKGGETMSIKNANNEIVTFSSDEKILGSVSGISETIEENERVVAEALNDLNERVSGITVPTKTSDLTNDSNFVTSAHTHSQYATTAETANFLTSAATLDDVADGTTRKLSDYSTTAHTHDQYSLTSHTHSEYATTAHTHTAAEVGAMATSERSNYLVTGTTLDNIADGSTRKLSNYSTTGHTHDQYSLTSHTHSDYATTAHTHSQYATTADTANYLPLSGGQMTNGSEIFIEGEDSGDNPYYLTINPLEILQYREDGYSTRLSPGFLHFEDENTSKKLSINSQRVEINDLYDQEFQEKSGTIALMSDIPASLDDVADGTTRKLSDYSTTGHTHNQYSVTGHTHEQYSLTSHTHSDYALTSHTHTASEVGAMSSAATLDNVADGSTRKLSDYVPKIGNTTIYGNTTFQGDATVDDGYLKLTSGSKLKLYDGFDTIGVASYEDATAFTSLQSVLDGKSDTGHTHDQYALSSHTHTAAEVGAMATSERSNYLATGTTLDNIADGTTRKLSSYSTTAHTHSEYATTAHTHTAAEVGAMATSERSNYSTTAHTHTAAEVGAMATSERSNYATTAHTHSEYATTAHTHTAAEVGAMATSERSNYLTTATTIPTESTISGSGFTKNAITGVNVNGSAATVTNGVADITVPNGLPAVTSADNGKILQVVNGVWTLVTPSTVYTGTGTPDSQTGVDGDIYLQTT